MTECSSKATAIETFNELSRFTISSTFYAQLLCTQIPKAQKWLSSDQCRFALLGSEHVTWCVSKPKLTIFISKDFFINEILKLTNIYKHFLKYRFKFTYGVKTDEYGCPLPCTQTSFDYKLTYNHINTWQV
jgi:hypothetical protein